MGKYNVFQTPQTIVYGRSSFENVGTEALARGNKALIISDKIMNDLGYVQNCVELLQKEGVSSITYLGVNSEPVDHYVTDALDLFKKEQCNVVISLGGGSCIDTAKAVSVLANNDGYIGDYMGGKMIATNPAVPHIAIPTTAGTGSEVTDVTVITNTSNDVKMMIKQPAFMPAVALVDPILTESSPKSVTAATGVDALCHAIEAYISKKAQPMTDVLALSAIELIIHNIQNAYDNGHNLDAREAMSVGSMKAGMAFTNASVCLVHGMSRPIGALFHVPHGISNAMLLPAILQFSKDDCIPRLADIGRIFKADSKSFSEKELAELAVREINQLCQNLNIPNLKGWGIDQVKFESVITKMAADALASGSPANNPKQPSQQEIEDLYRTCYDYTFKSQPAINN